MSPRRQLQPRRDQSSSSSTQSCLLFPCGKPWHAAAGGRSKHQRRRAAHKCCDKTQADTGCSKASACSEQSARLALPAREANRCCETRLLINRLKRIKNGTCAFIKFVICGI